MLARTVLFALYLLVGVAIVLATGRRHLARDPRLTAFVAVLLLLLAAGHVLDRPNWTYPFVKWGMYGKADVPIDYQEYLIEDRPGPPHPYPFSRVAPLSPRAFMRRLEQIVNRCRCAHDDALADSVIATLAAIHRERTGRTITRFEVYEANRTLAVGGAGARRLRYTWRPAPAAP